MSGGETALLAAAVGGGSAVLAAALATFGTYKVTNRSIKEESSRQRRDRLVGAYVDLIRLIHTTMFRVEDSRPKFRLTNSAEAPELSNAEEAAIRARLQALGSQAVRDLYFRWRRRVSGFVLALGELDQIAGGSELPMPVDTDRAIWSGLWTDLNKARDELRSLALEIESVVRGELSETGSDLSR